MKLLFTLDYFPPHIGGAETLFDNITRGVSEAGFDVSVVTQRVKGAAKKEGRGGVEIFRVAAPFRHAFPLCSLPEAARLARASDAVHVATLGGLGTGMLLKAAVRKPMIATFFEVWGGLFFRVQPFHKALVNSMLERAAIIGFRNDTLTAISKSTKAGLETVGVPARNVRVIYPGIDGGLFNPRAKPLFEFDFPSYLYFGRPGVAKGLGALLRAVPRIRENVPGSKLVLMLSRSPAREYERVVRTIRDLGIMDDVVLVETQPEKNVPRVIRSVDCVVVPSLSEGFGFSAAEAMACGKPVVASRAGSLTEIIDGKNGIFAKPGDPEDMAEKVSGVLGNRALGSRVGNRAKKIVKRFTWERCVKEYINLYSGIKTGK